MSNDKCQGNSSSSNELIILLPDEGWRAEANKIIKSYQLVQDSLEFNFSEQLLKIKEIKFFLRTLMFNSDKLSDPELLIIFFFKEWVEKIAKLYEHEQKTGSTQLKSDKNYSEKINEYAKLVFTMLIEKNRLHQPEFVEDITYIKEICNRAYSFPKI